MKQSSSNQFGLLTLNLKASQSSTETPMIKRTVSYKQEKSSWQEIKFSSLQIQGRHHHSSVLVNGKIYVYGGLDNDRGILGDFKVLDCLRLQNQNNSCQSYQWIDLPIQGGPGLRHSHSAIYYEGSIYIYGGKTSRFKSTNSIHAYNVKESKWTLIQPHQEQNQPKNEKEVKKQKQQTKIIQQFKPKPTDSHQAVVFGDQMIVYGGFSGNQFRNQIFGFNLKECKWRIIYPKSLQKCKTIEPQPRSDFSMVEYNSKLYIYAGKNLNDSFSDLWQFDLNLLKFTKIQASDQTKQQNCTQMIKRSGHSAIIYEHFMIVFGGITSVTHQRDDLILFDLTCKKWKTIWENGQLLKQENKNQQNKKLDSSKHKTMENLSNKNQSNFEKQIKKYRRPICQQKQEIRYPFKREKQKYKKQNQKKILILQQIQNSTWRKQDVESKITQNKSESTKISQNQKILKNICKTQTNSSNKFDNKFNDKQTQRSSPLLQSLTNSIMMTSHVCQGSCSSRSQQTQKQAVNISNQDELDNTPKRVRARDGHSTHFINNKMIIFGGDRHMIASNEIVIINLSLLINQKNQNHNQL